MSICLVTFLIQGCSVFISSTPRQDKRSISVALLWINYVWWNVIQLLVPTQFHAIIRTFCRCNKWVLHHAAEQHMLFLQWCLQEHLQAATSTGDSLDTHLCLELPLLYIRKVTRGWIVLSRERYLWSPWEISIWLLREGRGTRWGLCAASSECLQRGLLGPQEVSASQKQPRHALHREKWVQVNGMSAVWKQITNASLKLGVALKICLT